MIPGHGFRVFRALVEEGWRLSAICKCKFAITGVETYEDLNVLVNDHYLEALRARRDEQAEARR